MVRETRAAVIFDMDGVIVETGPQHFAAWKRLLAERGRDLSREEFDRTFGQRNQEILQEMLGDEVSEVQIEKLGHKKEEYYRALLGEGLDAAPGFLPLFKALRVDGFKTAVGTSAPQQNAALILEELSIRGQLDAVVTAEDVERGKPDPQVFLLAAQRCGVRPQRCVVLEDAVIGVQAAKAAGMRCIGVGGTDMAQADLVVDSLEQVTIATIESLLEREE